MWHPACLRYGAGGPAATARPCAPMGDDTKMRLRPRLSTASCHHPTASTLASLSRRLRRDTAAKREISSCVLRGSGRAWGASCARAYTDATESEIDAYEPWPAATSTCCACADEATQNDASAESCPPRSRRATCVSAPPLIARAWRRASSRPVPRADGDPWAPSCAPSDAPQTVASWTEPGPTRCGGRKTGHTASTSKQGGITSGV